MSDPERATRAVHGWGPSCDTGLVPGMSGDLRVLPIEVRQAAHLTTGDREVMWRRVDAAKAIEGLAAAGLVVLGLDVRRYTPDGSFYEAAWSALAADDGSDAAAAGAAALDALARLDDDGDMDEYEWILVAW